MLPNAICFLPRSPIWSVPTYPGKVPFLTQTYWLLIYYLSPNYSLWNPSLLFCVSQRTPAWSLHRLSRDAGAAPPTSCLARELSQACLVLTAWNLTLLLGQVGRIHKLWPSRSQQGNSNAKWMITYKQPGHQSVHSLLPFGMENTADASPQCFLLQLTLEKRLCKWSSCCLSSELRALVVRYIILSSHTV